MSRSSGRGRLIVLSGPSGVGKDTVIGELLSLRGRLRRLPTFTTRAMRPGEQEGREYFFVTPEAFSAMEEEGRFLETAMVHGNRYGSSREMAERLLQQGYDVLLKIDVQGAAQLRDAGLQVCFIFLDPPSLEELETRRQHRGTEGPEELALRRGNQERELAEAAWYQHRVVNDDVDRAAREIAGLLEGPPRG